MNLFSFATFLPNGEKEEKYPTDSIKTNQTIKSWSIESIKSWLDVGPDLVI